VCVSFTIFSVTHTSQPAYLDIGDENHVICLQFKRQKSSLNYHSYLKFNNYVNYP